MNNIAFIITGQLRTFFNNDDFINMINISKTKYNYVYCVFVLNPSSSFDFLNLHNYLKLNNIVSTVIDFSLHENDFKYKCLKKCEDARFKNMINIYYSTPKYAHMGIKNPIEYSKTCTFIQYYQLYIGLMHINNYIEEFNIKFDIICKTRFDCKYPNLFYPHIPNSTNTLFFNQQTLNSIQKNNNLSIDKLIEFNLNNRLQLPNSHIPQYHAGLSFGGMVCYNYITLQNIKSNGTHNILYAFNDYFYFGNSHTFFKLINIFEDCCFYKPLISDLYNHYFCPESQFIIYCLNNNIDIIMYPECLYGTLINR